MDYRQREVLRMENNPELAIGDVTTINLTVISGGKQTNIVPPYLIAKFDCRLAIDVDHDEFETMVFV